jgi:flavonoid 6-hydroxylase
MSKKYGDVMQLKLGTVRVVVISSPEFAKEVLKTNDRVCASRPDDVSAHILVYGRKDVICAPYGDHWRAMRKVCALELLSPSRVAASQNIRTQEVSFFVNDIFEHSKVGPTQVSLMQ